MPTQRISESWSFDLSIGADWDAGPPVPIPNTEVKLSSAEDSWLVTACENRKMPTQSKTPIGCFAIYSSIAQSVERMTVNHDVTGSSPVGGAKKAVEFIFYSLFSHFKGKRKMIHIYTRRPL